MARNGCLGLSDGIPPDVVFPAMVMEFTSVGTEMFFKGTSIHGRRPSLRRRGETFEELLARLPEGSSRIRGIFESLFDGLGFGNQLRVKGRGNNVASLLGRGEVKDHLAVADNKEFLVIHDECSLVAL
jgi:hypothetical protein